MQNLQQSTVIQSPLFQPIYSLDENQEGSKVSKLPASKKIQNINNKVHQDLKKAFQVRVNILNEAITHIQNNPQQCTPEDIKKYHDSTMTYLKNPLKDLSSRIESLELNIFQNAIELSGLHASFWGNSHENSHRFGSDFRLLEARDYVPSSAKHPHPRNVSEHNYLSSLKNTLQESVKLKEAAYSLLQKLDGIGTNPNLNLENKEFVDPVYKQKDKIEQIKAEANKIYNILSYESKKLKDEVFNLAEQKDIIINQLNNEINKNEKTIKNAQGDQDKISKAKNKLAKDKYTIEQINTYFAAINHRLEETYGIIYESHEFSNAITKLKDKYECKDVKEERKPLASYTATPIELELMNHQYKVAQFKEIQKTSKSCFDNFSANLTESQKADHDQIQSLAFINFGNLKAEHANLENTMNQRMITLNHEISTKGAQLKELRPLFDQLKTQMASLKSSPVTSGGWLSSATNYAASWLGYTTQQSPSTPKREEAISQV